METRVNLKIEKVDNVSINGTIVNQNDPDIPYYIIDAVDGIFKIFCDSTDAPIEIHLPTAVGNNAYVIVKKISSDSNTITIFADGAETVEGAATISFTQQNESLTFISNNVNWYIV